MRIKKRVLSGGVVVLTVFLVLGVCKPDIDKFCRQNRSITAFFASKGVDSFGEYLGGFMFDAAALGVCAVLVFFIARHIGTRFHNLQDRRKKYQTDTIVKPQAAGLPCA